MKPPVVLHDAMERACARQHHEARLDPSQRDNREAVRNLWVPRSAQWLRVGAGVLIGQRLPAQELPPAGSIAV